MNNPQSSIVNRQYAAPLGLRGLPDTVLGLNCLVYQLIERLKAAGAQLVRGKRLVAEMGLRDTRALRLLVAYARVARGVHEIVGLPGSGYLWATDQTADAYKHAMRLARRMGRCWFYIWSLLRRKGPVAGAVQLVLDFAKPAGDGAPAEDELAALIASEGVSVGDVVSGLIDELRKTDAGQEALADVAAKHADVLLPKATYEDIIDGLDRPRAKLQGGARRTA